MENKYNISIVSGKKILNLIYSDRLLMKISRRGVCSIPVNDNSKEFQFQLPLREEKDLTTDDFRIMIINYQKKNLIVIRSEINFQAILVINPSENIFWIKTVNKKKAKCIFQL